MGQRPFVKQQGVHAIGTFVSVLAVLLHFAGQTLSHVKGLENVTKHPGSPLLMQRLAACNRRRAKSRLLRVPETSSTTPKHGARVTEYGRRKGSHNLRRECEKDGQMNNSSKHVKVEMTPKARSDLGLRAGGAEPEAGVGS